MKLHISLAPDLASFIAGRPCSRGAESTPQDINPRRAAEDLPGLQLFWGGGVDKLLFARESHKMKKYNPYNIFPSCVRTCVNAVLGGSLR